MIEKNYTLLEVAEILRITRRSVYTYREKGLITSFKVGTKWLIKESDLKAFIDKGGSLNEEEKKTKPE
jgi:excisionase family DNA binding protein